MDASESTTVPKRDLYPVEEALELLHISRSRFYKELRAGRLRAVKSGRSRLVPATAITEYVQLLIEESEVEHGQAA